jgi:hypothetical protein
LASLVFYPQQALIDTGSRYRGLLDTAAAGTGRMSGCGWRVGTTAASSVGWTRGSGISALFYTSTPHLSVVTSGGFRTSNSYNGTIDTGNWLINGQVGATATSCGQNGKFIWRVFRDTNGSGASATELTAAIVPAGNFVSLSSAGVGLNSLTTMSMGSVTLTGEYLFFVGAWVTNSASVGGSGDVKYIAGTSGLMFITPNFTESPPGFFPVSDDRGMYRGMFTGINRGFN